MNLLPEETKYELHREYRRRFIFLSLIFLAFAIFTGVVAALPHALAVWGNYTTAKAQVAEMKGHKPAAAEQKLTAWMQNFRGVLTVLDPHKRVDATAFSEIIRIILNEKPDGVTLQSFSLTAEDASTRHVVLSGVAARRESLVLFPKRLMANTAFSKVDLPISNLGKREHIEFSITVTVKAPLKKKAPAGAAGTP
jgi:hypothetical protein